LDINTDISRLLSGRKDYFELIYKKYFKRLYKSAFAIIGNEHAAEDVVHDLFLYLWENRDRVKIEINLEAYLVRSVRNRSINVIQKKISDSDTLDSEHDTRGINTVEESYFEGETSELIKNAISRLPDCGGLIFRLSRMEEVTGK